MFYLCCLCFSCCFLHGSMAISSLQSHKVSVYFLCFLYCFSCCSGARQLLPLHFCLASYCSVLLLHFSLFITFLLSLLLFCFSYCISAFVLQFCRKRFSAGAAPSCDACVWTTIAQVPSATGSRPKNQSHTSVGPQDRRGVKHSHQKPLQKYVAFAVVQMLTVHQVLAVCNAS